MDQDVWTNPETCQHRVLIAGFTPVELTPFIICASCDTNITDKSNHINKHYEYDIEHNLWVRIPTGR